MEKTVTIASRFNGPPSSANGGYACGLMASLIDGPAEASLKAPPPLDKPLTLRGESGEARLYDGETVIGVARATALTLDVPQMPQPLVLGPSPVAALEDSSGRPVEFEPFGGCFVCGHNRTPGDGLCIHAHKVEGHDGLVAAPWKIDENLAGSDGYVDPVYIWSALDCTGYYACAAGRAALLGRLSAEILAPLKAEGDATVLGWDLGSSGRKHRCGTAIYAADGTLIAKAEGLWITVDPAKIAA
ncbi:hypothetical protein [Kordiimonas marina]|uniref:hypothetical protein n=1 Tax=Kordiimonas marina TaxID=2872312 RepID=UPI001FF27063|nr:hypothetical protein [Kordiimonas marina]MCJ9429794.1 hypothetical protein [Kordiimonas marina]